MDLEKNNRFPLLDSEKLKLGDLLFSKIKEAVQKKQSVITLFMMHSLPKEENKEGVVFTIDKNQFPTFLDSYLKICESEEMYEICPEIILLKKEFESIEQNENRGN